MKPDNLGKPKRTHIPLILGLLCLSMSLGTMGTGYAGWLLDPKGFHISAHGQMSCLDCHEDILDESLHPDPGQVNRNLSDFFSPEECLVCHDDIEGGLQQGMHGSVQVTEPETYLRCLECHDPHYQERIGDNRIGRFEPGRPKTQQCGACHRPLDKPPPFSAEDESCMSCHRAYAQGDASASSRTSRFCFHCHGKGNRPAQVLTGKRISLIAPDSYASTIHAKVVCFRCHPGSAQYPHDKQRLGECTPCHLHHQEKINHDAHLLVSCGACHLDGIHPIRDPASSRVVWSRERKLEDVSTVHRMVIPKDENCRACHAAGNDLGAAAMVLPPKSVLCMPCHAATFSVGDTVTVLTLIIFGLGMLGVLFIWFSGSVALSSSTGTLQKSFLIARDAAQHLFSARIRPIVRALLLDGLLQRRLFRLSKGRWFIHALIFWSFVIRFIWGFIGLTGSLWRPEWEAVWTLLDKNAPVTAFLFDLTGLMLMLGIGLSWFRGAFTDGSPPTGLPGRDHLALALIGGIVFVGFVLEGMRIAMTGSPPGSEFAFLGRTIARLFTDRAWLTDAYGYLWYLHAALTGMFIAYIPFSRLFHIIMGPIVLAMGAADRHEKERGERSLSRTLPPQE